MFKLKLKFLLPSWMKMKKYRFSHSKDYIYIDWEFKQEYPEHDERANTTIKYVEEDIVELGDISEVDMVEHEEVKRFADFNNWLQDVKINENQGCLEHCNQNYEEINEEIIEKIFNSLKLKSKIKRRCKSIFTSL